MVTPLSPAEAITDFAGLYGCPTEDFAPVAAQMTHAWKAYAESGQTLGLLGLRPSPAHGSEVMGGVTTGENRALVAGELLRAAQAEQPRLYAYAEEAFWPIESLLEAGFAPDRAYTRMSGQIPKLNFRLPDGFKLLPLSEVTDMKLRWDAQEGYSDLIGHTPVTAEAIAPNAAGSDDTLGCLAFDDVGNAVGVCRVWGSGSELSLTTPAVRPEARGRGLRRAMLGWVCQTARTRGFETMMVEAWGDSLQDRAEDAELGLTLETETPIYITLPDQS